MTRVRPSAFSVVLVLLAALLGWVALTGLEQDLRAARGEGVPGVFVAAEAVCVQHPGHESCTCHGAFTPSNGQARPSDLHAAGRQRCASGTEVAAVDTGATGRVHGPDGSREWMVSGGVLVACTATVALVAVRTVRPGAAARRGGG